MTATTVRMPPMGATEAEREHDRQKWVRLVGFVEGAPESTWKTRSVNVAALVAGQTTIEAERAKLAADAEEYHARWQALEASGL